MKFDPTPLAGAFVIEPFFHPDSRGYFARVFCKQEFKSHGLCQEFVQNSISFNEKRFTVRGMHFQIAPNEETKIVRCARGAIFDVIIDLRKDSITYGKHFSIELNEKNQKMVYIPPGIAHGFQTISTDVEVDYQISNFFEPQSARGVRWNDPAFSIAWPEKNNIVISERDANYRDFSK